MAGDLETIDLQFSEIKEVDEVSASFKEVQSNKSVTINKEDDDFEFDVILTDKTPDIKTSATSQVTEAALSHTENAEKSNSLEPNKYELSENEKPADVVAAEDEWENVATVTPEFHSGDNTKRPVAVASPLVHHQEFLEYCQNAGFLAKHRSAIVPVLSRSGFAAFKHFLFGPPKLHRSLVDERDLIFCIAAHSLENDERLHCRTLQTIFRRLTSSKFDCSRFGSHWEQIGFQGSDPATDLRGCGLLGLLHILFFFKDAATIPLVKEIFRLSNDEVQNFPFCVMSINVTRMCVSLLRQELFNKEINRQMAVWDVVNKAYLALFLNLYQIWKNQGKTIEQSGFVLQEVETNGRKNMSVLMKNLDNWVEKRKNNATVVEDARLELTKDLEKQ